MTTSLPLVFDEPRRAKKPPRHLADLTGEERRTAVAALGEPAFRAKQLSNHYFSRLVADPAEMTDLPAATRDKLVAELMPPLLTRCATWSATTARPARRCGSCSTVRSSSPC